MKRPFPLAGAIAVAVALALFGSAAAMAADGGENQPALPKITFIKEFPGSMPPYYSVAVREDGSASYFTEPDDPQPLTFLLPEPVTRQIFQMAARLNYFRDRQFEARKKVAAMGKKTLRYEAGAQLHQASFNYSENADAVALTNLFEKISITEQHLISLERLMRFDRLGVMKELLQIEIAMNRGDLVGPAQFTPLLEELAGNPKFMNIAKERAIILLERIRKSPYTANLGASKDSGKQ